MDRSKGGGMKERKERKGTRTYGRIEIREEKGRYEMKEAVKRRTFQR